MTDWMSTDDRRNVTLNQILNELNTQTTFYKEMNRQLLLFNETVDDRLTCMENAILAIHKKREENTLYATKNHETLILLGSQMKIMSEQLISIAQLLMRIIGTKKTVSTNQNV